MKTACFTGHRKIAGEYYNRVNPSADWLSLKNYLGKVVTSFIKDHGVNKFISGLAIGVDMLGAETVALCRCFGGPEVELIGAMPFPAQSSKWPTPTRNHFDDVCKLCNEVVVISRGEYHPSKMQLRNIWMVNESDYVIAIWDGISKGGTLNCIKYAQEQKKPVLLIKPGDNGWQHEWLT
jgi:uncharacterized phage-like protein YoqJ